MPDAPALLAPCETSVIGEASVEWFDLLDLGLEGRAWDAAAMEHLCDRLPARARGVVTERVWELGREAAGLRCRFVTDATALHARWWLRGWENMAAHIPQSGQTGLDLYARDEAGAWRWAGGAFSGMAGTGEMQGALIGSTRGRREYLLYLPYRHNIGRVLIGVPGGSAIGPAPAYDAKPLCFYGTSIVHGASATRAGMTYPAIVSRRLDRPFYNLGFGGNGPMHLEVAELIAELDAAVFVIAGCENMSPQLVEERAQPFAKILRKQHATTPIVFIGNLRYGRAWHHPGDDASWKQKNTNLAAAVNALREAGDANVHFLPGEALVGKDDEALVDGVHPSDLGFARMADAVTPVLRGVLERV